MQLVLSIARPRHHVRHLSRLARSSSVCYAPPQLLSATAINKDTAVDAGSLLDKYLLVPARIGCARLTICIYLGFLSIFPY
ncbi:hypothetical protein BOTBODRAFT_424699 [Botryobasidium botryosum FD-172 SS1]|uniref:Uncharacterized protein n=1 Tax=Botryobasidium botryosum (strain FD-172 SS1) TaxID=930990 RepID=A0A067MBP1_BOTB1|nr:hypothetical protein BOTBODRAFT_424699 [Botryobasidium botryosum FD-172 SS1]